MTQEIQTTKEPGQKNWASALSKMPEPFRSALAEGLRQQCQQLASHPEGAQLRPELSDLEQRMLAGGRGLSLITHAAYTPFHLLRDDEVASACDALRGVRTQELMATLFERLSQAQVVLLIGDDPGAQSIDKAIARCRKEGDIGAIVAGPGNLMEPALRAWALETGWPNAYLRTLDGSGGDVWHAQAGQAIDQAVCSLFNVHKPTLVALLEPVRLPATQSSIEQATHRKIPMLTMDALRLGSAPR